ncbi:MAG: DUF4249 domain-containing protein [Tannerellaceae bacterium]|nr:DUF4249 domain-containing protein [Tannerellaceae bacterium]
MKNIVALLGLIVLLGCELGGPMDIQDMGDSGGYFLECYCVPGDRYNLTATYLAPIAEPQVLDYSLEFDIYIQGDEKINMAHSFFVHPEKNFVYNYASPRIVEIPERGFLELYAISPTGETIYGRTEVPDQIVIEEVWMETDQLYYSFVLSEQSTFDYYVTSVFFISEGKVQKRRQEFNDFSQYSGNKRITLSVDVYTEAENLDEIRVELKRMTKDNYTYQLAIKELTNANDDSLTSPVMLPGNLTNALGIFTCYTEFIYSVKYPLL